MAKGNFTGTASSAELLAADEYRDQIVIQKTNATAVALGFGEAAVAGKGIQLIEIGDAAIIRGAEARMQINVIGNGGTGTYQTGDIDVRNGPNPSP